MLIEISKSGYFSGVVDLFHSIPLQSKTQSRGLVVIFAGDPPKHRNHPQFVRLNFHTSLTVFRISRDSSVTSTSTYLRRIDSRHSTETHLGEGPKVHPVEVSRHSCDPPTVPPHKLSCHPPINLFSSDPHPELFTEVYNNQDLRIQTLLNLNSQLHLREFPYFILVDLQSS